MPGLGTLIGYLGGPGVIEGLESGLEKAVTPKSDMRDLAARLINPPSPTQTFGGMAAGLPASLLSQAG